MTNSTRRTESNEEIASLRTQRVNTRTAGAALAVGSAFFAVGIAVHPPPSPDPGEFMATIADGPTRWMAAHWASAIALSLFAITGLIVLTADSRLTQRWWTVVSWAALVVGALWVTTAAVAEATVITDAAVAGDTATFEAWQAFADAYSSAFVVLALAIAVIAANEGQTVRGEAERGRNEDETVRDEAETVRGEAGTGRGTTPSWASWLGAVAGVTAFGGFVLGFGFGVALGGPVWLVATIVMSLWTLWFGVALTRAEAVTLLPSEEPGAGRRGAAE